jgi:hypothetical protein
MKKLLPLAVASALFGVNGAQAVHVNSDGLGQTLLYPFYTTEGGQDTLINVVNTTSEFKAVKVRILESMNSDEVLDFNLYLSPKDHWSAVITADPAGEGAVIRTGDNSCTVPNRLSNGETIPFRNFEYAGSTIAPQDSLARTKEGYVEIIEMGDIDIDNGTATGEPSPLDTVGGLLQFAIEHNSNGVPGGCSILETVWQSGPWASNANFAMLPPSGGLYGYGVIIDVQEGTDASYDAIALDDFSYNPLHTFPGSVLPSLDSGTADFDVLDGINIVSGTADSGIDAVSATLMVSNIANDFVLEEAIAAGTDWVVTFPTKKEYVNVGDVSGDGVPDAIAPFTDAWLGAVQPPATPLPACEAIGITYYDREEQGVAPSGLDFSPPPPGQAAFALCAEANVLTFNSADVLEASTRSGADLAVVHENGWLTIDFSNAVFGANQPTVYRPSGLGFVTGTPRVLPAGGYSFIGLPATGFAVQKYVNGDLGGVLSNYAGAITHKGVRSISD